MNLVFYLKVVKLMNYLKYVSIRRDYLFVVEDVVWFEEMGENID